MNRFDSRPFSFLVAALFLSCSGAPAGLTKEEASWQYVQEAWGGIALGQPEVQGEFVELRLTLQPHMATRVDSAICTCGASATLEQSRLLLTISKCLCAPPRLEPLTVSFAKPPGGAYEVVYDDADASYPSLGTIQVP